MPLGLLRPTTLALALLAGLVLAAVSAAQATRPAYALTNCSVSDSIDSEEREFLDLINQYRAQNGRGPLTISTNLTRSAAWMAKDLAENNYFSHTDSTGRTFDVRMAQCDATPYYGENIAAGTYRSSAQSVFAAWRASSGHNTNMLRSSFRQIGIARYYDSSSRYGWYWVTDFSTSDDGTSGSSSGSTGGSTSSPSPSPSPSPTTSVSVSAAKMLSPSNGATLSYRQTFSWQAIQDASGYRLQIGTTPGGANLLNAYVGTRTSLTISGFPSNGDTWYFRLWTRLPSGWVYNDYTYRLPR